MKRALLYVLAGITSVQVGAAVAKGLFDQIDPTTLTWLRLVTSAAVLVAWVRPSLRGRSRHDWLVVLGFAASLCTMNWAIYQAFTHLPIGLAVTIEFIGPLTIALVGSRRASDLLWVGLAGTGVALLGIERADVTITGIAYALLAGAAWAAYILLSSHTGRRWAGLDGLAVASLIAVIPLTPYAVTAGRAGLGDPAILVIGAVVGLMSSVIPYSLELAALRHLSPATFGTLMSLEPAAAALAALVILGEVLAPAQWIAIACVVAASVGATRSGITAARPANPTVPPPAQVY
jgi:inner membrane transporter RhtA